MEPLRWVLLLIGVAVIAVVFLYSRGALPTPSGILKRLKSRRPAGADDTEGGDFERREPLLDAEADIQSDDEPPSPPEPEVPSLEEGARVITARIMPGPGAEFPAEDLVLALRAAGMRHGQFKIFHRMSDEEDRIRFSVASLVEPGSFDLSNLADSAYKGISIFMVLPAPEDGVALFDEMMETARDIARRVDGSLVDEQGGALSIQRERYMREEIIEYLRQRTKSALHARDLTAP